MIEKFKLKAKNFSLINFNRALSLVYTDCNFISGLVSYCQNSKEDNAECSMLKFMFLENIKLSAYSNYKIGGLARYFFEAKNVDEIIKALDKWRRLSPEARRSDAIFILGGGTNVLFNDEDFNGLVLKPNIQFINPEENFLKVGAGVPVGQLVNNLLIAGLSGLEWAAGLPGTVGGAIRGNAGSFGGEMQNIVKEVVSLDISKPKAKVIKRNNQDCNFNYRSSIFKLNKNKEIIIEATLILKKGDRKLIREIIEKNINYRKQKQPLEHPSIGSIFRNVPLAQINADYTRINTDNIRINQHPPAIARHERAGKNPLTSTVLPVKNDPFPVIPAAHLISEAGLEGVSCGGAMISPKHPNFIVNILDATAKDVKNLIQLAKKEVKKIFNIDLEEEVARL